MPTSLNVTPHRVLPFILTIPLLLFLVAIPPAAVDTGIVSISVGPVPRGFSRAPLPAPWDDDVFTDGIPPDLNGDDLTRRKARPSRTVPLDEQAGGIVPLRPGVVRSPLVLIEKLLGSFLIGLPPPVVAMGA